MSKKILVFLVIFLSGCANYQSSLDVKASGRGVRYGLVTVKEGEVVIQKRRIAAQQDEYHQKYLTCLENLNATAVPSTASLDSLGAPEE